MRLHSRIVVTLVAPLLLLTGPAWSDSNGEHHRLVDAAVRQLMESLRQPEIFEHLFQATDSGNNDGCGLSLKQWANGLRSAESWALQMVDSSSKFVTGILYGNMADLGNFDECVKSTSPDGFSGRYILPFFDLQRYNEGNFSTLLTLRLAACVPSTCDRPLLEATLEQAVGRINAVLVGAGLRLEARLPHTATAVAGLWRAPAAADFVVIFICALLVLLVFLGTALDLWLNEEDKSGISKISIVLSFSAWTNGKRLLAATPSDSNFTCINGIRFLSAVWVVLGHRYLTLLQLPCMNLIAVPERLTDISTMIIVGAALSVDTFFCIGGLVNCYVFMKIISCSKSFNFVLYYFHRYIRLTPAFALMVAITATWIGLLSNGPLWAEITSGASDSCRLHWWTAMLYVANYVNPDDQCMMQSWYLMADMQLHWASPLLLYPLWRWRRLGVAWLCAALVASCAMPLALTYAYNLPTPFPLTLGPEGRAWFMRNMYYATHARATSYICGTLAGYILFHIKSGSIKRKISKNEIRLGWLLSTALCLVVVLGMQPLVDAVHNPYNVWSASFYAGLHRPAWCFAISWVVLACILGHGGPVNGLLSWTPFTVLGRLSYGIYLTHAAVQIMDHGTVRTTQFYSDFHLVEKTLSDTVLASVLGACLCLALESPISSIEKSLRSQTAHQSSLDVKVKSNSGRNSKICHNVE